ncbi:protein kinase family protein, partial [Arthrobacter crystallopoietes BAB-32]
MPNMPATEISSAVLNGRYQVGPLIGRGGMGSVYRGIDHVLQRQVAVKVLHRAHDGRQRLDLERQEVLTMARLNHPGLVALYDAGTTPYGGDDVPWLVMELIDGVDLGLQLEAGPLDQRATALLGSRLAATLHYIHNHSTVHRDIKPSNVMLAHYGDDDPQPKLADFGIATLIGQPGLAAGDTTIGTAAYLSLEQVRGGSVGPASDIYSLGLVLLQCLTGEVEYPGPSLESALARLDRPPRIPPDLLPELRALLAAMTAAEEPERPDALDVARTLRNIGGIFQENPAPAPRKIATAGSRPLAPLHLLPSLSTGQLTNATRALAPLNPPVLP